MLPVWAELIALALLLSVALWLAFGRWIATPPDPSPSVFFVTASPRLLAGLVATTLLSLVWLARLSPAGATAERARELRWQLRPLWLAALTLLPHARLAVEHAPLAGPFCHFTLELRAWIALLALAWCFARTAGIASVADLARWLERMAARVPSALPRPPLTWIVFVAALGGVAATSQLTRFQGLVAGDEPKYIRFCEALLQTQGFDVESVRPYGRIGLRDVDWLGFPRAFAATIADEVPAMLRDLGTILTGRAPSTFNRATYDEGWFIHGKNGGTYQVHLPGLSFLLFVPYTIDRLWLSEFGGIQLGVPNWLFVTSTAIALVFACWITALYRLLRDATRMPRLAALVALATGLTIPVVPFHAQYYPEAVAGLLLVMLVRHLEVGPPAGAGRAAWMGLLAGYLPWLHNRFALPSLFLVAWFVARHPRNLGALTGFLGTYGVLLALQSLYYYRITGSILPTSMWAVIPGHAPLEPAGIPKAIVGLIFDRTFGILGYAPIYALAPAAMVLAWRANRGRVLRIGALVALLIAQATAHFDWWGGGSTPARLIVTAIPFAAMGFAELARATRGHRGVALLVGVLLVVSLDEAFAYTHGYSRLEHGMRAESVVGYRTPLSFPGLVALTPEARPSASGLIGYWIAMIVAANALTLALISRTAAKPLEPNAATDRTGRRFPWIAFSPLLTLAGTTTLYTAPHSFGGEVWSSHLLPDAAHSRAALLDSIVRHPFGWVIGAGHGCFDPERLKREWLTVTYLPNGDPPIESLKGAVVDDDAPAAGSRERAEPRPALRVPAAVRANTRVARIALGPTVGGRHSLEIHLRRGETAGEPDDAGLLEVRVLDDQSGAEIARRTVTTSDLGRRRYRAIPLDFDLPHDTAAVVRLTKLGGGELWIEKATLRHE